MAASPFVIFPWQKPFLPDLKAFLIKTGDGFAGKCLLITPNRRPWRYLLRLFASDRKTGLLPKMLTISELALAWWAHLQDAPLRIANIFDQVAVLHDVATALSRDDASIPQKLARMDMEQFLPWGMRLAAVLEEFAIENISPTDLSNFDGELSETAASILQALGRINAGFRARLAARGWTSMGLIHQELCARADKIPQAFLPAGGRPVAIAGFYRLSGSHEIMLKSLWRAGARICLHSDPALAIGAPPHWACGMHKKWRDKWGADACLYGQISQEEMDRRPELGFFAGYDFHSQLEELSRLLGDGKKESGATAIILGKSDTLMPTLHQLANRKLNISMGYPLGRTCITNLLELLLDLQENRIDHGKYHSRDILRLLCHPALGLLDSGATGDREKSLCALLREERTRIAGQGKIWELPGTIPAENASSRSLAAFFKLFLTDAEEISSLAQLAEHMERVCAFFIDHGAPGMVHDYPLEAEAVSRLHEELFPLLRNSALANSVFSVNALHGLLTQIMGQIRIPFEADPMLGLQVIGMLESRLLHFDRVLILDATDDILPGSQANDPLMPDFLKSIVGLPDSRAHEESAAHNLYRLCAGARRVDFLWQEGTGHSDFYDSKKVRSRYVEQFIWEMEKENPSMLLTQSAAPVRNACAALKIIRGPLPPMRRSKALDGAIKAYLQRPLAVSQLDDYLYCPRGFILKNIMRLRVNGHLGAGLAENPNALAGSLAHAVLRDLFAHIGPKIQGGKDWTRNVQTDLREAYRRQETLLGIERVLPIDKALVLRRTVPERISDYLEKLDNPVTVLGLEKNLDANLHLSGRTIRLRGRADRLDDRDGSVWIIDYKTGRHVHDSDSSLWEDEQFFKDAEISMLENPETAPDGPFSELLGRISSIQLAAYLVMMKQSPYCRDGKFRPANAAWVYLRRDEPEIPLLARDPKENLPLILTNCAIAIGIILEHIASAREFGVLDEGRCAGCQWKRLCSQR